MPLSVRPRVYSLPSYSLTGDLLGFLRCGLQYRYTRLGRLPSTRPVQLWFGQFIHAVMEEAFRRYRESVRAGTPAPPPWPLSEVNAICDLIKARLASQGLFPWEQTVEDLGDLRARVAIQELGPYLLPVINQVELRLTGTRELPPVPDNLQFREADRYEMAGVVDVITHVELENPALAGNPIVQAILARLPEAPPAEFEVIVDYKGTRRPSTTPGTNNMPSLWEQYAWQVMTYAELRRRQPEAWPVVAGVLIYVNELAPTRSDLVALRRDLGNNATDATPLPGSLAAQRLAAWRPRTDPPELPFDYRLARSLRVVPVSEDSIKNALDQFDGIVRRIETCRGREMAAAPILDAWERNPSDESTCAACDSRTFCPSFTDETRPRLPGVRSS